MKKLVLARKGNTIHIKSPSTSTVVHLYDLITCVPQVQETQKRRLHSNLIPVIYNPIQFLVYSYLSTASNRKVITEHLVLYTRFRVLKVETETDGLIASLVARPNPRLMYHCALTPCKH